MARKYSGIDGKNRQERETLYYKKFESVHKNQRHLVKSAGSPAAAAAAAPGASAVAASQAAVGRTQPQGSTSSPGDLPLHLPS